MKEFLQNFGAAAKSSEHLDGFRAAWREILPKLRVLCLTEGRAHVAMWYHYADEYRGVVFEFRHSGRKHSIWSIARPVSYPQALPTCYTANGWAESLTLKSEIAVQKLMDEALFTKSPDWKYEQEWRLVSFSSSLDDKKLYLDLRFDPAELVGIYLGPFFPESRKAEILDLAKKDEAARVYSVSIGMAREFHFSVISN